MHKRIFIFLAVFVFITFSVGASNASGPQLKQDPGPFRPESGQRVMASDQHQLARWNSFIEAELAAGGLVGRPAELEPDGSGHQRLDQYYQGLPVRGGQIIRHYQGGTLSFVNGRYYQGIQINIVPGVSREKALEIARGSLSETDLSLRFDPALVIYPLESGYALAYKVLLGRRGKEMLSFIDAATGAILLQYDDTKYDATIGTGTGVHGDLKKVSVDSYSGTYRTWDKMRPAVVKTYDYLNDPDLYLVWYYYAYTDANLSYDGDNSWTGAIQSPVIDGHDYAAWTYDYYYIVHGRKSYNNANMLIKVQTNFDIWETNAFYDGNDHSLNFFNGDQVVYTYLAGALDVVSHEYTHGVTDYTSGLDYYKYSGALNESFSDIMAACVEFYFEPAGTGFQKADWFMAEDASKSWNTNNAFRRLDKPYLFKAWGTFPYPDHWTKRYTGSLDYAGVHINSSISNHWFYLLTVGGTNRISGITVTGIGREKAEKIAYKAWTSYLFPSADFWDARAACIQAAVDLHGAGSTEVNAVKTAWQAVGIY